MIKKNTLRLVVLIAIVTVLTTCLTEAVKGNLIENGSFENYAKDPGAWSVGGAIDFNLGPGNTDITGWTVTRGQIDYVHLSQYTWQAADGECSIDLGGSPGSGGVSQTFATTAGQTYRVQFSMSGNPTTGWSGEDQPDKTLSVQAAGQSADFSFNVSIAENSLEDMKWKLCTFFFTADSDATTLEIFSTMEPVHIGPVIDNVSVENVSGWSPAGTYTGTNNYAEELIVTIIPVGQNAERFSIVRDALNQNPGFEGRPISRGEMIKVGPNEYASTVVAHLTDADLKLQWKALVSGMFVQTGPDSLETTLSLALYTPDQDPFADGTVPAMCLPGVKDVLKRVPIVAPCVPTPPPPGP